MARPRPEAQLEQQRKSAQIKRNERLLQALDFLKSLGCDLNFKRGDGATALDLAVDQEQAETVPSSESLRWSLLLVFCFLLHRIRQLGWRKTVLFEDWREADDCFACVR